MTHVNDFFGEGADVSVITPDTKNSKGELRCCVGVNTSPHIKWYGINGINPEKLSFCSYCKYGFDDDELFEITHESHPGLIPNLVCDSSKSKLIKPYIGERRCVKCSAIKINVNIVDKDNYKWRPVLKMRTEKAKKAEKEGGVLLAKVPTMSFWEFVVQGNEDDTKYYNDKYYFKVEAEFGDKRKVVKTDQDGSTNFYTPILGQFRADGYNCGEGNRFFFQAPCQSEITHGMTASHNNESNILYLTVKIFEKQNIVDTFLECDGPQYRGGSSGTQYRGGGGAQYRGGSSGSSGTQYRGGSSKQNTLTGGSNFGANGYSSNASTHVVRAKFVQVTTVKTIIQLVNDEDDSEKLYMTQMIQKQVESFKEKRIQQLIVQRNKIDEQIKELREGKTPRTEILDFNAQENFLI